RLGLEEILQDPGVLRDPARIELPGGVEFLFPGMLSLLVRLGYFLVVGTLLDIKQPATAALHEGEAVFFRVEVPLIRAAVITRQDFHRSNLHSGGPPGTL